MNPTFRKYTIHLTDLDEIKKAQDFLPWAFIIKLVKNRLEITVPNWNLENKGYP